MGIGIGTSVIRNHEFLKTIQSRHPLGIYSQEEFLLRVKNGDKFFSTKGQGSPYHPNDPSELISTEKYSGTATCMGSSYTYLAKVGSTERDGFVSDFFWSGNGIFLSQDDMKKYKDDFERHHYQLQWEAI